MEKLTGPRIQFRLDALEVIKKLYLPQPNAADITGTSLFSWFPAICWLTGESDALDHSLLTFCVIQVAVTRTGSASIDDASGLYSTAIQKLLAEIKRDNAGQSDEILAAISVLSTYEVAIPVP